MPLSVLERYRRPGLLAFAPDALTPPDNGTDPAFNPNAAEATAPPEPMPPSSAPTSTALNKPTPLNGKPALAATAASGTRNLAIMPPPGAPAPAAQPVAPEPPPAIAPETPAIPGPKTPPRPLLPPKPPSDLDTSIAQNQKDLAAQHAAMPEAPKSNWGQRLGLAMLSMTKLAPYANQIVHPKWTEQQGAYTNKLKDIEAQQKELDTAASTAANVEAKEAQAGYRNAQTAQADLYKHQTDPHYGMQQLDPGFVQQNLPGLKPDESGQFWVDKSLVNELSKPDSSKPIVVPEGSTVVSPDGKVLFAAPPKTDKPTGDFERQFLPAWAGVRNKTVDQLTPQEKLDAQKEFKTQTQDPELAEMRKAAMRTEEAVRQMQLNQQPTPEQANGVAQDIIAHRLAPEQLSSMFGGFGSAGQAFKRMVYGEAKKINPEFNFEQAAAEYELTKSPSFQNTVRYMDSANESVPLVIQRATELANGKIRFINGLQNMGRDQLNDPKIAKFQTDALFVADEIAKILQGGGTGAGTSDAKLKQAADIIKTTDSPQVIAEKLRDVQQLLAFRRKAMTRGTYMENAIGAPQSEIPTPKTQQEFDALPKGAQFKKPNDPKIYIKQ